MSRAQKLFFSAMLASMMAMHAVAQLLKPSSTEASWLSMAGIGVSVLLSAAAVALFLKTRSMRTDGVPFFKGDDESRRRSIRGAVGVLILCLVGTSLMVLVLRLVGIGSAQVSRLLDSTTEVAYPLFGSIALLGLIRKRTPQNAEKVAVHL